MFIVVVAFVLVFLFPDQQQRNSFYLEPLGLQCLFIFKPHIEQYDGDDYCADDKQQRTGFFLYDLIFKQIILSQQTNRDQLFK